MTNYLEFKFTGCHVHRDILIAFLQQVNFEGFNESVDGELTAYIAEAEFNKPALTDSLTRVPESIQYTFDPLPDKNWNEVWESNFEPIIVDDFCLIRADFHKTTVNVEHTITINPKQSFGTGHHETTFMMIQQMRQLDLKDKSVYDIGTGTGILAILAEKLGAKDIVATENDSKAILNAHENIGVNDCHRVQIEDHNYPLDTNQADIVLANINMNVLFEYAPIIKLVTAAGGTVILSGILESQLASVLKQYTFDDILVKKNVRQKGEWCLVQLEKK